MKEKLWKLNETGLFFVGHRLTDIYLCFKLNKLGNLSWKSVISSEIDNKLKSLGLFSVDPLRSCHGFTPENNLAVPIPF